MRHGVLLAGAICNGAFAAAAMWLAGRALGLIAFEALAQLWTLWGLVAIGVAFAFQQWEVARNVGTVASRRLPVPVHVKLGLLAAAILVLALTAGFRVRIFGSDAWVWPLAAATLPIGTAITGIAYATLARAQRLPALALVMAAENGLRLLMTGALAAIAAPPVAFALTIPAGFLVSLVPLLVTPVAGGRASAAAASSATQIPALAVIGSATNFLVFGGPLLLGAAGGQAAVVSTLFLVLIIARVPALLVNAVVPAAIVAGTEAVVAGDAARVRRWVVLLSGVGFGLAGLVGPLAYAVADPVAAALFQAGGQLEPVAYGLLAVAAALLLALTLTNPLLIAMGRLRVVAIVWGIVVVSGAVLTATGAIASPISLTIWMSVCAVGVVTTQVVVALTAAPVQRTRPSTM